MELRALRYFVAVADELHFGRAAERLGIVQPAVSQQVARLERELGTRLIDRSTRHVRLTDAGRRVLDAARDALAATDRIHRVAGAPVTRLRIGSASGLTARLERGIAALRAEDPDIDLVLVDLPVAARIDAVRRGELDLALVRGVPAAPGLSLRPAWSEALHAVVSRRHHAAGRASVTIAEMAPTRLRVPSRDCDPPLHEAVTLAFREAGVDPSLGRPTGTVPDTVVEVGADPGSWALLPADQVAAAGSCTVASIPLSPPLAVCGTVVAPRDAPERCVDAIARAFRGQDAEESVQADGERGLLVARGVRAERDVGGGRAHTLDPAQ